MTTFEQLGLKEEIVRAVGDLGFEHPTVIQEKAIPYILSSSNDLLAFAQTGTGKTAAFSLPLIHQLEGWEKETRALILCPTRELCLQISRDIQSFITHLAGLDVVAVYGGESIEKQIRALNKGGQIVVGTPGRTVDLIKRKKLKIEHINYLVFDEADEMLTMGFKDDLDFILDQTPAEKQTLLFSATRQDGIERMVKKFMNDPEEIHAGVQNAGAETLDHSYYFVHRNDKYEALKRLLDLTEDIYGIVFCRTRRDTQELADKLIYDNYDAECLHGDMSQAQREHVMRRFRKGSTKLLIATDVAARGIDVNDLSHVINYELPEYAEVYIHRSGRTGRAGKSGLVFSLVSSREKSRLFPIERMMKKRIPKKQVPSGEEVFTQRLFGYLEEIVDPEQNGFADFPQKGKALEMLSDLTKDELIERFLGREFERMYGTYMNAPDLNISRKERKERRGKEKRGKVPFTRFHINLGSKQRLNPLKIIGLINEAIRIRNVEIGEIEILRNFSFFELDKRYEKELMSAFENYTYRGKDVIVEPTKNPKPDGGDRNKRKRKRKRKK